MKLLALITLISFVFVSGAGASPSAPKVNNCGVFLGSATESTSNPQAEQMATAYIKILEWLLDRKLITLEEVQETVNSNSPTVPQNYIGLSENYHAANQGLKMLASQMNAEKEGWTQFQKKSAELLNTLQGQNGENELAKQETQEFINLKLTKTLELPLQEDSRALNIEFDGHKNLHWTSLNKNSNNYNFGVNKNAEHNGDYQPPGIPSRPYRTKDGRIYFTVYNSHRNIQTDNYYSVYELKEKTVETRLRVADSESPDWFSDGALWEDHDGNLMTAVVVKNKNSLFKRALGFGKENKTLNIYKVTGSNQKSNQQPLYSIKMPLFKGEVQSLSIRKNKSGEHFAIVRERHHTTLTFQSKGTQDELITVYNLDTHNEVPNLRRIIANSSLYITNQTTYNEKMNSQWAVDQTAYSKFSYDIKPLEQFVQLRLDLNELKWYENEYQIEPRFQLKAWIFSSETGNENILFTSESNPIKVPLIPDRPMAIPADYSKPYTLDVKEVNIPNFGRHFVVLTRSQIEVLDENLNVLSATRFPNGDPSHVKSRKLGPVIKSENSTDIQLTVTSPNDNRIYFFKIVGAMNE